MATLRPDDPPQQPPRSTVTVPPELVVGALAEVWADGPHDLGTALDRHGRAQRTWEQREHLDTATACTLASVGGPWSLDGPGGANRLARLDLVPDDLPRLRRAAGTHDTHRRTT